MSALDNQLNLKVLDTFKLEQNGIFLKALHIERTLAALQLLTKKNLKEEWVLKAYDLIGELHASNPAQRVRIVFDSRDLTYDYSLHALEPVSQPLLLDVIHNMRQPSGLGAQNYKWEKRDYWEKIMELKNRNASDVISLNELGNCVETTRHNLFFYDPDADLVFTPSLYSGCISGVYRQWVLSCGKIELPELGLKSIRESEIHFTKLDQYQLFAANSVRGVLSAALAT